MNFLPQDYEAPKSSNSYMKLEDGENKFRILSKPIIGWEDWTLEKKPVRFHNNAKPVKPIDSKKPIKHFWSFIVWNYVEEQIQVLHLTQATIRSTIEALCKDKDWGAPFFYDIKIVKKGEGVETKYMVNPLPHKPVSEDIRIAFSQKRCNLEAIFSNADPFSAEWKNYTPGIFEKGQEATSKVDLYITDSQLLELQELLNGCDPVYKNQLSTNLLKTLNCESFDKIPSHLYEKIRAGAEENNTKYQNKLMEDIFG